MFGMKNRAVQIKLVKTSEDNDNVVDTTTAIPVDFEEIAKIATKFALRTVVTVGIAVAANTVVTAICDAAVHTIDSKLK